MIAHAAHRLKQFFLCIFLILPLLCYQIFIPLTAHAQKKSKYNTTHGIFNPARVYKSWGRMSNDTKNVLKEQAEQQLAQVKSNPKDAAARFELGKTYYELCLLDEAQEQFEETLELDAANLECQYLLGCVYYFTHQHDKRFAILKPIKRRGFRIDPKTTAFFRKRTPDDIDQLRKKIHAKQRAQYRKDSIGMTSLQAVLALPDNQIDVATAALLVAQNASQSLYDTSIEIEPYIAKLDAMADELHILIDDETDPSNVISIVNNYIFNQQGFVSVDKAQDYFIDPDNIEASMSILKDKKYDLLNVALDTKKGTSLSLSMLIVSLAQRLDLPISAALAPFHLYLRYDDGQISYNMEPTYQGKHISTTSLLQNYPDLLIENTWYMRPLTPRETVFACITGIAELYIIKQDYATVVPLLLEVLDAEPAYLKPYITLGNIFYTQKNYPDAIEQYKRALELYPRYMPIRLNLAVSYLETGELPSMYDVLKQGEKTAFDYPPLLYLMGLYYVRIQNFKKAEEYLLRADKHKPNSINTYELLVNVYCNLAQLDNAHKYAKKITDSGQQLRPELFTMIQDAMTAYSNAQQNNDDK